MKKLTPEEQVYWDKKYDEFVKEKLREAEEDDDEWLTEEEFWEDIRQFDEELRRKNQLKNEKNIVKLERILPSKSNYIQEGIDKNKFPKIKI